MLNLSELSQENLEKTQKILKIVLDWCQLGFNQLTGIVKIPLEKLKGEGLYYDEIKAVLASIEGVEVINEQIEYELKEQRRGRVRFPNGITDLQDEIEEDRLNRIYGISKEDLDKYLLLRIQDLDKLKEVNKNVDKKIQEITGSFSIKEKQEVKVGTFEEEVLKTKQLLDKLEDDINKKINAKAKYNNGILYFRGKEIDFRNKPNQKELLATLFKEPMKNWSYDEIYEDWGEKDFIEDGWRKLYTAGDGINKAVAIETSIKDFIIKNTKQIQIKPKYI